MTIASCYRGVPWASAVFYASDGFDLYFLSSFKSRHGQYIALNPRVSAAIQEDYRDWREIRGIQLEGRAERMRSAKQKTQFWEIYLGKFPFVKKFFEPGPLQAKLSSKLRGIGLYRIVPAAIWYLDNRKGFGHREKFDIVEPQAKVAKRSRIRQSNASNWRPRQ
ncbi:MAG: hypothetical protein A3F68_06560 [Acidobacteria bacterium RIFCSPLOWO2_12_FULL_54_10]|nr:MAG: hypothetical protein A3F68_06560 [Acidobacteria bacterium RIFCSPLOWO2_12_FULL_54_10]